MAPEEHPDLEARACAEVRTVLTEGDLGYLQALSREGLIALLETELTFLGLYPHSQGDAPARITRLVETHIDRWRAVYLGQCPGEPGAG